MAYDEYLGERISQHINAKKIQFESKKMIGGLVFMINNKMTCGIHIDKKYGDSLLMAKIGETAYANEIEKKVCLPMDFTGRPMKGYIFITPEGFDLDDDLDYWLQLAIDYNHELYGQ